MNLYQINNANQLFDIIEKNSHLCENNNLLFEFKDNMWDYLYGCPCLASENSEKVKNSYLAIADDMETKKILINFFNCDGVVFAKNKFI
jgi:hypothetical protein